MESTKNSPPKLALILGGGAMFGAYQAGVWEILAPHVRPHLFIGASVGALNAWAFSAGCPPAEWAAAWLTLPATAAPGLRRPHSLLGGCIDTEVFEQTIRQIHSRFTPAVPCAVALTDLVRLKPWLAVSPDVTWRHLAASCAVVGIMPQYRIAGRWQTDGGLLTSVPLWAAAPLGVTHAIAVNLLPGGGPCLLRALKLCLPTPPVPLLAGLVRIEHSSPLGSPREAVVWNPATAARLLQAGRDDARAALPAVHRLIETF